MKSGIFLDNSQKTKYCIIFILQQREIPGWKRLEAWRLLRVPYIMYTR